jgi:predicted PurR-regulated permease PerM
MVFGVLKNLTEILILGILLIIVTLFLLYMILNVNNKMNEFIKIYEQEQQQQYNNLESDFQEIDGQNSIIKEIINNNEKNLPYNTEEIKNLVKKINELGSDVNKNNMDLETISDNLTYTNTGFMIGNESKNNIELGSNSLSFNLNDGTNRVNICKENGSDCKPILHIQTLLE